MLFHPNDTAGAVFSDCRQYRYRLWRVWDTSKPAVAFCMLNPSTADENVLDPTLRRCMNFAKSWGFGRMDIVNIFAFRSTDPGWMKAQDDPIGKSNGAHILECALNVQQIVCAWGVDGDFRDRDMEVLEVLSEFELWCLGLTKMGHPFHPLFRPASTKAVLWKGKR